MYLWKDEHIHISPTLKLGPTEYVYNGIWKEGIVVKEDTTSYEITTDNGRKIYLAGDHLLLTNKNVCPVKNLSIEHSLSLNSSEFPAIPSLDKNLSYAQGLIIGLFLLYGEYNINEGNTIGFTLKIPINVYNNVKSNLKKYKPIQSALIDGCIIMYYNDNSLIELLQTWIIKGILNIDSIAQSVQFREGIVDASFTDDKICSYNQDFLDVYETLLVSLGRNTDRKVLPYSINDIKKYGLYLSKNQWTKVKAIEQVDNHIQYTIKYNNFTLSNGIII